jgi:dolichol kinase
MQNVEPDNVDTLKSDAPAMTSPHQAQIEYHNELARKAIHVFSIAIPLIYYHITKKLALVLLTILFLGFFTVDAVKMFSKPIAAWYFKTFGSLLRPHEKDEKKKSNSMAPHSLRYRHC